MSGTQKSVKSKRGRTLESTSLRHHKKRRIPSSGAVEVSNRGHTEAGSIRVGTAVNAAVTPRPPLHNDERESGVMAAAERVVVDLTNDSGVEDEGLVDLTSPIQQIPPITSYLDTMGAQIPPITNYFDTMGAQIPPITNYFDTMGAQIPPITSYINTMGAQIPPITSYINTMGGARISTTTAPRFQQDYANRPSCLYSTPVHLVESDEEVEEVNTCKGLPPLKHSRDTSVSHTVSSLSGSSQGAQSRTSVTCPICLETVEQFEKSGRQLVTTVCGHIFCNVCVRNSISRQHACPTCRKKLTLKQYHPLFL